MRHFGGDPRRPLRPVLNPVLDGWSCASRSCCREATYGHCGARERTRLGSSVRSADVEDSGPVDFQWGCRSCGVRRDHRIGHGRSGPVPISDRPAGQGRCGFSPWGGCCAIRSQTRIDPVHVVSDTGPQGSDADASCCSVSVFSSRDPRQANALAYPAPRPALDGPYRRTHAARPQRLGDVGVAGASGTTGDIRVVVRCRLAKLLASADTSVPSLRLLTQFPTGRRALQDTEGRRLLPDLSGVFQPRTRADWLRRPGSPPVT